MLIAGLQCQRLYRLHLDADTPPQIIRCRSALHLSRTCDGRNIGLIDIQVVHVILQEEGIVENPTEKRLIIRQADDMFRQHVIGRLKALVHIVPAVVARTVEGIAQVHH